MAKLLIPKKVWFKVYWAPEGKLTCQNCDALLVLSAELYDDENGVEHISFFSEEF